MDRGSVRRRRQLSFESLEARTLLAGDVTARMVNGDLVIRGDDLDNRITIDRHLLKRDEVRVTVDVSSTLNGFSGPEIFSGVTGSIRVRLFGGNDRLMLDSIDSAENIVIDAGHGDDMVLMSYGRVSGDFVVFGRSGNDGIHIVNTVVAESLRVDAGEGDNVVVLDGSRFAGSAMVRARDGHDSIFLDSRFQRRPLVQAGGGDNLITRDAASASFDFRNGAEGWQAGFAEYHTGEEEFFELESGIRPLPHELDTPGTGFFIRGSNHSDDLFMFLKRQIGPEHGLQPDTTYQLRLELVFASNVPTGCHGIGGSPGESVFLKGGAGLVEPLGVPGEENRVHMNVDKGNQSSGGPAASVIGNISNGIPCDEFVPPDEEPPPGGGAGPIVLQSQRVRGQGYISLRKTHVHEFLVRTDSNSELWLLVGTDSGFEGPTALYYQRIAARLTPVSGSAAITPPPIS